MKKIIVMLFFLVGALSAAAQEAPSLRISLNLEPAEILVGEPAALRVEVENLSDTPVRLPRNYMLQYSGPDGVFITQAYYGREAAEFTLDTEYTDDELLIGAGRRASFYEPVLEAVYSPIMNSRLNTPGVYGVTMGFISRPTLGYRRGVVRLSDLPLSVGPVFVSNTASLRVRAPSGVDAEVWRLISDASHGGGWEHLSEIDAITLGRTIRAKYPTSRYALTFGTVLHPSDPESDRQPILAMLEQRAPRGPMVDWFRLYAAGMHVSRQSENLLKDISISLDEVDKITDAFTDVIRRATNDIVRRRAQRGLDRSETREEILQAVAAINAAHAKKTDPPRLLPIVQCVRGTGEGRKIVFGYFNPGTATAVQPPGPNNQFQPEPIDQGQPSEFASGQHLNVFEIRYNEKTPGFGGLQWLLDGTNASVPDDLKQCEGNDW